MYWTQRHAVIYCLVQTFICGLLNSQSLRRSRVVLPSGAWKSGCRDLVCDYCCNGLCCDPNWRLCGQCCWELLCYGCSTTTANSGGDRWEQWTGMLKTKSIPKNTPEPWENAENVLTYWTQVCCLQRIIWTADKLNFLRPVAWDSQTK